MNNSLNSFEYKQLVTGEMPHVTQEQVSATSLVVGDIVGRNETGTAFGKYDPAETTPVYTEIYGIATQEVAVTDRVEIVLSGCVYGKNVKLPTGLEVITTLKLRDKGIFIK